MFTIAGISKGKVVSKGRGDLKSPACPPPRMECADSEESKRGGGALYVQFRINSLNWDNTTSNRRLRVRFK